MDIPLEITLRNLGGEPNPEALTRTLTALIEDKAAELGRLSPHVMRCSVLVDDAHGRLRNRRLYRVELALTVPGGDIVVSRDPAARTEHEDAAVAVRDAFRSLTRGLMEYESHQRLHTAVA